MKTAEEKQAKDLKQTADHINSKIADSDPHEGTIVAVKYTFDGEVLILRKYGKDIEQAIPTVEFKGLPKKWRGKHTEAMTGVAFLLGEAKKVKDRMMPLTRQECLDYGIHKLVVKDLERFGYIVQRLIQSTDEKTKRKMGGMMIIYFTPQGRAYMENAWKKWEENSGKNDALPGDSKGG